MTKSATFTEALIHVLETDPRPFANIARQTNLLPGAPRARDYSDAEIDQLNTGFVRMLLEALRQEDRKARTMFTEEVIPNFVRQGETPLSLIRWNASYLVLFGPALASSVPSEYGSEVLDWFAGFAGPYLTDVLRASFKASASVRAAVP
jgi:hypothetical protein